VDLHLEWRDDVIDEPQIGGQLSGELRLKIVSPCAERSGLMMAFPPMISTF
jgi:hypothetical protein